MKKIFLMLFLIFSFNIFAHPHVFFETALTLKTDNKKMEGVEIQLILDELNTKLNRKILKPDKDMNVEKGNIVFLKHLYKHIRIKYNNKTYKENDIIFEQAKLEDDSLEIYFFVPLDEKIEKNSKLTIALYDTKYYYNYDYDLSSLRADNRDLKAKVKFFTNDKIKFYFNLVSPDEYEVTFEWKI